MYITETGIADKKDDKRAIMIKAYLDAVGCLFIMQQYRSVSGIGSKGTGGRS